MKKQSTNNNIVLTVLIIATIIIVASGVSFAYFSALIMSPVSETAVEFDATVVSLTMTNGSENKFISSGAIIPGWSDYKTFKIVGVNTSNQVIYYDLILEVSTNTFSNSALSYELTTEDEIKGAVEASGTIPTGKQSLYFYGNKKPTFTTTSDLGITHEYTFTLKFPNEDLIQYEQGKEFYGYINIVSDFKLSHDDLKQSITTKIVTTTKATTTTASATTTKAN